MGSSWSSMIMVEDVYSSLVIYKCFYLFQAGQPFNFGMGFPPGGLGEFPGQGGMFPLPGGGGIAQIPMGGVPGMIQRPPGAPTVPGQPLASTNPVIFMEVNPQQAVTINSISAHLVETNPDGTIPGTTGTPTSNTSNGK